MFAWCFAWCEIGGGDSGGMWENIFRAKQGGATHVALGIEVTVQRHKSEGTCGNRRPRVVAEAADGDVATAAAVVHVSRKLGLVEDVHVVVSKHVEEGRLV